MTPEFQDELCERLALAGLRLKGARAVEEAATRNLRSLVLAASSQGIPEKEITEAIGGVVHWVTVRHWLTR